VDSKYEFVIWQYVVAERSDPKCPLPVGIGAPVQYVTWDHRMVPTKWQLIRPTALVRCTSVTGDVTVNTVRQ